MISVTVSQVEDANFRKAHYFEILQYVFHKISMGSEGHEDAREIIFRILEAKDTPDCYRPMLDTAIRELGYFPYLAPSQLGFADAVAYEVHRPIATGKKPSGALEHVVFHRDQAEAYWKLVSGHSLILSAPTSFGKSLLIDAVIASRRHSNIVIVVPTIALIDETRRRLSSFSPEFKVITHPIQRKSAKNIFVLTQERVIEFEKLDVDFFVIDEFYKLNPKNDAERAATLNHAFYKLSKLARQFYMLGPNISAVPEGFEERYQCTFFKTDSATVASRKHKIYASEGTELDELVKLCKKLSDPTLIFCSSPPRAKLIVKQLIENGVGVVSPQMVAAAKWVGENYNADWMVTKALESGIGIHHGRIPRAIAQFMVRAFNDDKIRYLVCTSTLIEGVNTKARNVVVFDDTINRAKYDYFTFCNIKGRSGRMWKHFVGDVYLFHAEPQAELPIVDIPVFTQAENGTLDDLFIQISEEDLKPAVKQRVAEFRKQTDLDFEIIKANVGVDPSMQIEFAKALSSNPKLTKALGWGRLPTNNELLTLCEAIFQYFVESGGRQGGIASAAHLAFRLSSFRQHRTLAAFIADGLAKSKQGEPDDVIEELFNFLRHWVSHRFGKLARAIQSIQNYVAQKQAVPRADYSVYAAKLEHYFSDAALIALDEYGLPFPLAKKLEAKLSANNDLDETLSKLRALDVEKLGLDAFEKALVKFAQDGL